jgi:hypothetical protein
MGGKPSAPQAPDPYTSAAAQYQYGTQAAKYNAALNRINTVGPAGSVTYSTTQPPQSGQSQTSAQNAGQAPGQPIGAVPSPFGSYIPAYQGAAILPGSTPSGIGGLPSGYDSGPPIYTQTTTLSPEQQAIYNAQQQGSLGLQGLANAAIRNSASQLGNPLGFMSVVGKIQGAPDTAGVPNIPGVGNLAGFTNEARNAAFEQQKQYLDPQFSQAQEQLDAQLRNSGAHPGDPAYDNAMKLFTNQKQQAYQSAANNAIQQGLAEEQGLYGIGAGTNAQLFGQAISRMGATNQAQGQQYGQDFVNQNLPINQLNAIRSGAQVAMPTGQSVGTAGAGNAAAPDIMGAMQNQYLGQLNAYNAQTGSKNNVLGDLGTLGSAYLMS